MTSSPLLSSRDGSAAERQQQPRRLGWSRGEVSGRDERRENTRLRGDVRLRIGVGTRGACGSSDRRHGLLGTSGSIVLLHGGKHCRKAGPGPATQASRRTVGTRRRVGTRRTRGRRSPDCRRARARERGWPLRHDGR